MRPLLVLTALTATTFAADDPKTEPPSRADRVQAAFRELDTAQGKLRDEFKAAKDPAAREKLDQKFQAAVRGVADKLLALAKEQPDDEPAFQALGFALANGDADAAADLLAKHHLGREQMVGLLPQLADDPTPAVQKLLRAAVEGSPLKPVKAAACVGLGAGLVGLSERTGDPKPAAEAEALFTRAAAEFGDQPWEDGKVKAAADGMLADLKTRGVGRPAPEFASKGLDDQPAKLSDLKGKVVVLDIWATWCGPCRQMIPHERELVERLKGQPFALVSVSADRKKEVLTDFLKDEKMPWTHWYEGGDGPNLKAWNVRFFPTIYVIDAKGVIRYKGVREKALDDAVAALLKEAAGK